MLLRLSVRATSAAKEGGTAGSYCPDKIKVGMSLTTAAAGCGAGREPVQTRQTAASES